MPEDDQIINDATNINAPVLPNDNAAVNIPAVENLTTENTESSKTIKDETVGSPKAKSFKDRLESARLAMEGPERTVKREEAETEHRVKEETERLEKELGLIGRQKEKLEINWVVLDTKQSELKKLLEPIKEDEETIELEEDQLEGEEHTTIDTAQRQEIEKKRWAAQDRRKDLEKRKWEIENKILAIEAELKKNTDDYQKLLDQEEVLSKQVESLEYEVEAAKEKVRMEEDRHKAEAELLLIEEEKKRRATEERRLAEETIKKREAELAAKRAEEAERKKAEEDIKQKAEAQKKATDEERLKKIAEEQKHRAELEVHRQEEARKAREETTNQKTIENTTAAAPVVSVPVESADENSKRAAILEAARAAAAKTSSPIEMVDLSAGESVEQVSTDGSIQSPTIGMIGEGTDVPSYLPDETNSIPKMRTFKADVTQSGNLTEEEIKAAKKKFPWLK